MRTVADYWKKCALDWEESSYGKRLHGLSWVEKLATLNRGHIRERKLSAEKHLATWIPGKKFIEIGCGAGALAISLVKMGASRGIGVDLSDAVIMVARIKAEQEGVADRVEFMTGLIEHYRQWPAKGVDLVVGLGILEYLEPSLVKQMMQYLKPKELFFAFDERKLSLKATLHFVYRKFKRIPYYKKYSGKEIKSLFEACGFTGLRVFRQDENSFISSIRTSREQSDLCEPAKPWSFC